MQSDIGDVINGQGIIIGDDGNPYIVGVDENGNVYAEPIRIPNALVFVKYRATFKASTAETWDISNYEVDAVYPDESEGTDVTNDLDYYILAPGQSVSAGTPAPGYVFNTAGDFVLSAQGTYGNVKRTVELGITVVDGLYAFTSVYELLQSVPYTFKSPDGNKEGYFQASAMLGVQYLRNKDIDLTGTYISVQLYAAGNDNYSVRMKVLKKQYASSVTKIEYVPPSGGFSGHIYIYVNGETISTTSNEYFDFVSVRCSYNKTDYTYNEYPNTWLEGNAQASPYGGCPDFQSARDAGYDFWGKHNAI